MLDFDAAREFIDPLWDEEIVPELVEYIRQPNLSPMFDPDWAEHGHMDAVVAQFEAWCRRQTVPGMSVEVVRLPGRTPVLLLEIPGQGEDTVLLYGHLDKQPEMSGWSEGLGPWTPVLRGERLYGRGGADDGYALFASLTAVMALQRQGVPHARCVILIEACEESGSPDLPHYVDHLAERIGAPSLVVCLDSGAGDYERMWLTTSLRGMLAATLRVDVLTEGVHSGGASGPVASSFRILRSLLARLEDADSGRLLPDWLHVEVPAQRREQAAQAAAILGDEVHRQFPFVDGAGPVHAEPVDNLLARTWSPTLSFTGQDGLPALAAAGNVLRPHTALMLSFRFPPTLDVDTVVEPLRSLFESDPPYGARVRFTPHDHASGWHAPVLAPWLEAAAAEASRAAFGRELAYMGEGGTIPFMGMLGEKFPAAQFVITGVLGPHSNAHGPNEFLDIPTARRLTLAVAGIVARHHQAAGDGLTAAAPAVAGHRSHGEACC